MTNEDLKQYLKKFKTEDLLDVLPDNLIITKDALWQIQEEQDYLNENGNIFMQQSQETLRSFIERYILTYNDETTDEYDEDSHIHNIMIDLKMIELSNI